MARNSTRVDYRKLDKNDGGHTTWRRKSAAGWIIGGGTISNISKAERKRVYDLIPGPNGCQVCVSPAASTDQLGQMAPDPGTKGCTGRRDKKATYKGVPYINWIDADLYFNSCETDTLIFHGNEIAIVGGLAAAFLGATVKGIGQGLITAVISAVIALGVNRIDKAQRRSNKDAIYLRVRYTGYIRLAAQ